MLKRTERISFRIYSVLSKVEPESEAKTGPSTGSGYKTLHKRTLSIIEYKLARRLE